MPGHLGLFMEHTWRLHPDICAYTSEVFYEGRLEPRAGNVKQGLAGVPPLDGTGVRFLAVDHVADRDDNDSPAEAEVVAEVVGRLLSAGATWTDSRGRQPADHAGGHPHRLALQPPSAPHPDRAGGRG